MVLNWKDKKIEVHGEGKFSSAHKLENYEGDCKNLHGHSWLIKVSVRGNLEYLNEVGILFDFREISNIAKTLDHRYLNDFFSEKEKPLNINPTCELITLYIYSTFAEKYPRFEFKVRVYENVVGKENYSEISDF